MTAARALALACLLVLAGCANPLGAGDTPTETPAPLAMDDESNDTGSPTPDGGTGDGTATPDDTPTPSGQNVSNVTDFPPGVSESGIDDAGALFRNHSRALERTGFVAIGNGTSVVSRSGLLVDVETDQRNSMAANGSPYEIRRDATAGPVQRSVHIWSNGSIEYINRQENSESNYTAGEPRPVAVLTGNALLGPYVRGGDFEFQEVRSASGNRTIFVLRATEIANATILERAVPEDAEEVTGYDAAIAIDEEGRIRVLDATVEYVISGQAATQEFTYELTSIDGAVIPRPDWVDEAQSATNETATGAGNETATPADLTH